MQRDPSILPPLRDRVAQACDTCKHRKVKCDGQTPCGYCKRRQREQTCHFSPPVRRRRRSDKPRVSASASACSPSPSVIPPSPSNRTRATTSTHTPTATSAPTAALARTSISSPLTRHSDVSLEEEAEVPRDARLICDAQGRLVFIGDCAPLSLFQTVRQIVTSRVDPDAFAPETSRVSMLENINSEELVPLGLNPGVGEPVIDVSIVQRLVGTFLTVTSGLVELFDPSQITHEIATWASQVPRPADVTSAVNYLVLAIGSQSSDEQTATTYFLRGKHLALAALTGNLSVGTVQSFLLTTLYMLRSCQINAAFLFFGIAARAAYAIGLHRTEVNSRFGPEVHIRRDRLWKSVRVLDLYLSISMGRPPAASDADCTVPYHATSPTDGSEVYDLLNASVQILSVVEGIVLEVYSRRKISLQLTEGISRQLREWSGKWLAPLLRAVRSRESSRSTSSPEVGNGSESESESTGACQVLSSYYYAVMLVSRPFLMYELCKRLPDSHDSTIAAPHGNRSYVTETGGSGRAKLANACIDAATLMIGMISDVVEQGSLDGRMPLIVSWLFASSLVVGVSLLGGFGRSLEKHAYTSVAALNHFAKHDAHASQYARITESLRVCALEYLEKRDVEDRRRIAEDSTQLFGLMPQPSTPAGNHHASGTQVSGSALSGAESGSHLWETEPFGDFDPSIFSFSDAHNTPRVGFCPPRGNLHDGTDQVFGAINLFPLLDGNGHIDLAHLL